MKVKARNGVWTIDTEPPGLMIVNNNDTIMIIAINRNSVKE